jgi:coenzyme PQQ precursor peptide PqqA
MLDSRGDKARIFPDQPSVRRIDMPWKKPVLREVSCGMEINMYGPAEDEGDLF